MATRNSTDKRYYISPTAVNIVENVDGEPRKLIISVNSGSVIQVWSEMETVGPDPNDKGFFRTDDQGRYKRWTLRGRRPYLSDSAAAADVVNLYVRISNASDVAEFVFSTKGGDELPMSGVQREENPDEYYYYIPIGRMEKMEDGELFNLTWDSGFQGTDEWNATHSTIGDLFEVTPEGDKIIPKKPFSNLTISGFLSLAGKTISRILTRNDKESEGANAAHSDEEIATAGYLNTTWLTKIRGFFVNKDTTGEESMKGSLNIGGNAKVGYNLDVKGKADVKGSVTAASASISGDMSSASAHVTGDMSAGSATVSGEVKAGSATVSGNTSTDTLDVSNDATAKAFKTTHFSSGDFAGSGAAVYEEQDGETVNGYVETDYMSVRKAAWFREVTIEEVKHVGGELILSQAACCLSRVQWLDSSLKVLYDTDGAVDPSTVDHGKIAYFKCYFEKEANGKKAYNEWAIGDLARCQVCNLTAGTSENVVTKYYWREVVGVGDDEDIDLYFILLSNLDGGYDALRTGASVDSFAADCSSFPAANDNVVLLGSRDKGHGSRTTAQVMSTVGKNAPSRKYYHGITDFVLNDDAAVELVEWDSDKGFPHWRIGDQHSFIDFDKDGLRLKASSVMMSGTGKELAEQYTENINVHMLEASDGVPTPNLSNTGAYTASGGYNFGWTNPSEHLHDVCVTSAGVCYRWEHDASRGWLWRMVTDKYLVEGMRIAENYRAEFTAHKNEITNWRERIDPNGKLAEYVESGLVTTADYAKLFSQKILNDETGEKTLQAEIAVGVSEGMSNVNISADQINLQGYTNINGRFRIDSEGKFYAEEGVFGGMNYNRYNVVSKGNEEKFGYYEGVDTFVLDIDKCGSNFLVYSEISQGSNDTSVEDIGSFGKVNINLPSVGVVKSTAGSAAVTRTWRGAVEQKKASQYIGKCIRICCHYSDTINIGGVLIRKTHDGQDYIDTDILTIEGSNFCLVTLECVEHYTQVKWSEESSDYMFRVIGWEVVGNTPVQMSEVYFNVDNAEWLGNGTHTFYFPESYHIEPDRIVDCYYNQQNTVSVDDKHEMYAELERMENTHTSIRKRCSKFIEERDDEGVLTLRASAYKEYSDAFIGIERQLRKEDAFLHYAADDGLYQTPSPLFPSDNIYDVEKEQFGPVGNLNVKAIFDNTSSDEVAMKIRECWLLYYEKLHNLSPYISQP